MAADADLCRHCLDDRLLDGIIAGICDLDLAERIQALNTSPSLQQVANMCHSHEAARKSNAELPTRAELNKLTKYRERRSLSRQRSDKNITTGTKRPSCFGCGDKSRHSEGKCPAKGIECKKCHKTGHFATICQGGKWYIKKTVSKTPNNLGTKSANANSVTIGGISTSTYCPPCPKVQLQISSSSMNGKLTVTPDTGAEITAIGVQHFLQLGGQLLDLCPPSDTPVYAANGSSLNAIVKFEANDYLSPCSKISPSISHVAFTTLPISESTIKNDLAQLRKDFSDVLVRTTDLQNGGQLHEMKGPPMTSHLKSDAQPFAVYTPRVIPLAWRHDVKKELDTMVSQNIIEPVGDEPCEWCHPLVVVPKPKGGVRLTVDLSRLNKQVVRTAHPSPTPYDAVRQITQDACFFSTLDATMGYWQIPLSQNVQHLTTFITPWGRYRFKRSPMGFVSSGEFCRRGDIALSGIDNCIKVIDDVLVWDTDYAQLLQRLRRILIRCRQHGITINADKFNFAAPEVQYCGYTLS
ncbi:uncharacterized protein [Penaeus vannamei]|uniref:uncharacterized protein n=1 Tax=Penaeus vannamei TaxID=6689 RepID=UPI00387F51DF